MFFFSLSKTQYFGQGIFLTFHPKRHISFPIITPTTTSYPQIPLSSFFSFIPLISGCLEKPKAHRITTGIWRTWPLPTPSSTAPSSTRSKVKKSFTIARCFCKFRHFSTSPAEVDISLAFLRNLNEPRVLYSIEARQHCFQCQTNSFPSHSFSNEDIYARVLNQ